MNIAIRKANVTDIRHIHRLLHAYSHQGDLIPRPLSRLYDSMRDFVVAEESGTGQVVGCCALQFCWESLAEVRSLAVEESCRNQGIATRMVETCLQEARDYDMEKVFCLTFKADFFQRFGFIVIDRSALPLKIWSDCMLCVKFPDCEGIAMMKDLTVPSSGYRDPQNQNQQG